MAATPTGGLLVVEDLDSLAQPELTAAVADIADALPAGWRLLVGLSRAVPSPLARLGRRGKLVTLDEDDLVLSRQESADLVEMLGGRVLPGASGCPHAYRRSVGVR